MLIFTFELFIEISSPIRHINRALSPTHRDNFRVQMPANMFPHLKLLCLLFMGPTLGFDKETGFFYQIWCFFTIKPKFWQYYSWLNMRKSHFCWVLVLLGPIISRFLHVQMRKKINKNNKGCLLSYLYASTKWSYQSQVAS